MVYGAAVDSPILLPLAKNSTFRIGPLLSSASAVIVMLAPSAKVAPSVGLVIVTVAVETSGFK
jgi:hypothetical protein